MLINPVSAFKNAYATNPITTQERRFGSSSAAWKNFTRFFFPSSHIMIAIAIATIVPIIINARLYRSVFLVMIQASFVLNKNSKFSNPHHSLPKMPFIRL